MDFYSRVREKNACLSDQMLTKVTEYFVQGAMRRFAERSVGPIATGEYDELLTMVKKRKLQWFGHVQRFWFNKESSGYSERKSKKEVDTRRGGKTLLTESILTAELTNT